MSTLTWRPGSLLPYTSLWLILRKLAYLNSLRIADFPLGEPRKRYSQNKEAVNDVDLLVLSDLMAEPLEAFSFCDSRFIPKCWRFLFTSQNAFCETCMSLGYHTRLFSLKLLNRCPIHNEPLQIDCPCMGEFGERVDYVSLKTPYTCHCASLMYFHPDRLHKNDHLLVDTNRLKPIVNWLESLMQIHVGSYMNASSDSSYESDWLIRLADLSLKHDFPYPSELIRYEIPYYRWAYKTKCMVYTKYPALSQDEERKFFDFYHGLPKAVPADVYKSFARHVRKHVARRAEYWVSRFKDLAMPEEIAHLLRTNQKAKLAFTELIWATCIETSMYHRRWDNRIEYNKAGLSYIIKFSDILADAAATLNLNLEKESQNYVKDWLRGHTFGMFCLAIWRKAEKMVEYGIRRNLAFWDSNVIDQKNLFGLTLSRLANDKSIELTFYVDEPLALPKKSGLSKEQRVLRYRTEKEETFIHYFNVCTGLCSSWSENEGWHTAQSPELSEDWKLHRVMITPKLVLKALLYRAHGYFVLRLIYYNLQVFSLRTVDLFVLMKLRFQEYCENKNITLVPGIDSKIEQEKPVSETLRRARGHYECNCILEMRNRGFCESAAQVELFTYQYFERIKNGDYYPSMEQ